MAKMLVLRRNNPTVTVFSSVVMPFTEHLGCSESITGSTKIVLVNNEDKRTQAEEIKRLTKMNFDIYLMECVSYSARYGQANITIRY